MAIQLVHTFGRQAGGEKRLDQDVIRFGRAADNDVVFDAEEDRIASTYHAEIRREGSAWVLVDLDSKNGTWVEGRRVDRHAIESGDEIVFGTKGPRVRVVLERDDLAVFAPGTGSGTPGEGPPLSTIVPPTSSFSLVTGPMSSSPSASPPPDYAPPPPEYAPPSPEYAPPRDPAPPPEHASLPEHASPPDYAPSAQAASIPDLPAPPPEALATPTPALAAGRPLPLPLPPPPSPSRPSLGGSSGPVLHAPPAGARPGRRTIDEMISAAFRTAPRGSMTPKEAAAHRTRTTILYVLLASSLVAIAVLIVWNIRSQRAIDKLSDDLASVPHPPPAPKGSDGKAAPATRDASFSRRIYDANKKGIFMLASDGHGFCTAFAIRPSILATNAHCVKGAQRQQGTVVALENEGRGKLSFRVTNMKAHPSFREQRHEAITPDVGLIYIAGKSATVLEVATAQELARTGAGDEVYLIGFPGRLMNAQNPSATFMAAHVGRITDAQGQPSTFARGWLVEHDAQTTGGTSGSPVFDGRGKVIAINAGTYVQQDGAEGTQVSPYKYAMRIDLLNTLLQQ